MRILLQEIELNLTKAGAFSHLCKFWNKYSGTVAPVTGEKSFVDVITPEADPSFCFVHFPESCRMRREGFVKFFALLKIRKLFMFST